MSILTSFYHAVVILAKRLIYFQRGEPYEFCDVTLRYVPGTRPVRTSYRTSSNDNVRFDALQVELVDELLAEGDYAIDVGAHAGQYALLMAAKCGESGVVYAFEPDPKAKQVLLRNINLNPEINAPVLVEAALSDKVGETTLYSMGGNSQSSLARTGLAAADIDSAESISVSTGTLDDYVGEFGRGTPTLVKIDTEGAEINILKGSRKLLESNAVVVCELHPYAWSEFGVSFEEMRDIATSAGRSIHYLGEEEEVLSDPSYGVIELRKIN